MIPPVRLGALLRTARRTAGLRRRAAAAEVGVDIGTLRAFERGTARPTDANLASLAHAYGLTDKGIVPKRELIDAPQARSEREVIAEYVDLIESLRRSRRRGRLRCRASDLEVLAAALRTDSDDIDARIAQITGCNEDEARRLHRELLRRRLLVPLAGATIGAVSFGGAALAASGPQAAAPHVVLTPASESVPPSDDARTAVAPAPPSPQVAPAAIATDHSESEDPPVTAPPVTSPPETTPPVTTPVVSDPPPTTQSDVGSPDVFIPEGETFTESP